MACCLAGPGRAVLAVAGVLCSSLLSGRACGMRRAAAGGTGVEGHARCLVRCVTSGHVWFCFRRASSCLGTLIPTAGLVKLAPSVRGGEAAVISKLVGALSGSPCVVAAVVWIASSGMDCRARLVCCYVGRHHQTPGFGLAGCNQDCSSDWSAERALRQRSDSAAPTNRVLVRGRPQLHRHGAHPDGPAARGRGRGRARAGDAGRRPGQDPDAGARPALQLALLPQLSPVVAMHSSGRLFTL